MGKAPVVALFCDGLGHLQKLEPLIAELRKQRAEIVVFGHPEAARRVIAAGCRFVDLYDKRPSPQELDDSFPPPSRHVTFAAQFAEALSAEVRKLGADLVLADSFAVIGRVVSRDIGLPWINLCAGHNAHGGRIDALLAGHPRLEPSEACLAAADHLRTAYGIKDASPFSFFPPVSGDLNVYFEPPEFLTEAERRAYGPVVFFGSLPADHESRDTGKPWSGADVRIYVSMGTMTWYLYTQENVALIRTIGQAVDSHSEVEVLVSLGNAHLSSPAIRDLTRSNVRIVPSVNQWEVLAHSDVFVTHHGLKSTHEAIWHRVPMLSYPTLGDQPGLAHRAQSLGLARPLASAVAAPVEADRFARALDEILGGGEAQRAAFERARGWERDVIAGRPAAAQRILELA